MTHKIRFAAMVLLQGLLYLGCNKKKSDPEGHSVSAQVPSVYKFDFDQTIELIVSAQTSFYECTDAQGVKHKGEVPNEALFKVTAGKISAPADVCPKTTEQVTKQLTPDGMTRIRALLQALPIVEAQKANCYSDGLYAGFRVSGESKFIHIIPRSDMACTGSLEAKADWDGLVKSFQEVYETSQAI